MKPLLKPHINRLNGSIGSGTDLGRTTVSFAEFVNEFVDSPARANNATFSNSRISATCGRAIMILILRRPQQWLLWGVFPSKILWVSHTRGLFPIVTRNSPVAVALRLMDTES